MRLACPLAIALCCATTADAQCVKPAVPAGGFPVTEIPDQLVTYSDGGRTYGDLILPAPAAPSCGWPLVVHVHGLTRSRSADRSTQRAIAARGFAVWTYDVRGHGDFSRLNPPGMTALTLYGPVEKYDLAEQIYFARARFGGLVDGSRLGVTGSSQGGIHAWIAASYSQRMITLPGRGSIRFPRVDAAVPLHVIPESNELIVSEAALFRHGVFGTLFSGPGTMIDPGIRALFTRFWLAQDPAGLSRALAAEPGRLISPGLANTDVPILYHHAYLDRVGSPQVALPVIATIPASTPVQTHFSTLGHGSPFNAHELQLQEATRIRWLDRFLWGVPDDIAGQAPWQLGVLPLEITDLVDPAHLWGRHHEPALPAVTAPTRYYLTDRGSLESRQPTNSGAATIIRHRVNPAFTPAVVMSGPSAWSLQNTLQNIPLSERKFDSPPLPRDTELAGSTRVRLRVVSDAPRFALSAMLLARLPGTSHDLMIANRGKGVLNAQPGVAQDITLTISIASAVLPRGTRLTIVLRNHWIDEPPMPRALVTAPYLSDSTVSVLHGTGSDAPYVDLPLREPRVTVVSPLVSTSTAAPAAMAFTVRGGVARAGRPYVIAASASGHVPGLPLPGGVLPLEVDAFTGAMLGSVGTPLLSGFVGVLDGSGEAAATFGLPALAPLPPGLLGERLSFAAWVFDGPAGLAGSPSNPIDLTFD